MTFSTIRAHERVGMALTTSWFRRFLPALARGRALCRFGVRPAGFGRRTGVSALARIAVAAGAGHGHLAQDLRRGDPRRRARSDAARPRNSGPPGPAAARPGRVRADAGRLHQGGEHRAARRAGQEARRPSTRARWRRSSRSSACPATCCWRSGAARPRSAATSCPRTPSRCWRRRATTAAARRCSRRNCSTRSRCSTRAT